MMNDTDQLAAAGRELGVSFHDLWIRYIGLGGNHDAFTVRSHVLGAIPLSDHDHIVIALNEAFGDMGVHPPIAYRVP
jgi:hypothetical protein